MEEFAIVHNIPSPYRIHTFNVMNEQLRERGIAFKVHFMASGHEDRPDVWQREIAGIEFSHTFWRDRGIRLRSGFPLHWNPAMVRRLWAQPPKYLMVGGQWDSATGMAMTACARRSKSIAWLEPNTQTPGRASGFVRLVKRWILEQYRHIAVPGEEGRRHLVLLGLRRQSRIAFLPNLVDESRFSASTAEAGARLREALDVPGDERLALCVARLHPDKGICEYLSRLGPADLDGWRILIVGDGPLRSEVEACIAANGLEDVVQLMPSIPYDQMPALYRASDLFLLPSLADPNPLSVVEAMHSGLPILISNRVGNYPEALDPGTNGWGFNPSDDRSAIAATQLAFNSSNSALQLMGQASRAIAAEKWDSKKAISAFLNETIDP